ncbi:MAG: putative DNA-binding domain-containing protein [Alphaproteobacteria bacterium]|nr:putative DNA-binding domain-containing protein [Alphaproteobacteria bacterium]
MPSLRDIQRDFSRALLGGSEDGIVATVLRDRLEPAQRVQIYRNHTRITLREALAATFPAVERLVGPGWFATACRHFVEIAPPRSPVLAEYGAEFAAFLETAPNAPAYLADVARLEWALSQACRAPDAAALAAAELAAMAPEAYGGLRLAPLPATALLGSPYPILSIWRANRPGAPDDAVVDLAQGGQTVLVWRGVDGDVACRALADAEGAFVGALVAGRTLGEAAEAALSVDRGFDLPGALAALLAAPILKSLGRIAP